MWKNKINCTYFTKIIALYDEHLEEVCQFRKKINEY